MIDSDIIEFNIVGDSDRKTLLLRCFPFVSKLKSGDKISTGQYINYQSFTDYNSKNCSKNFSTA